MIAYIEKGPGLHDAIRRAGYWLREENGVWVSSNDEVVQTIIESYSLDQAKAVKSAEVARVARDLRNKIIADLSPGEMSSWPIKLAEAAAFKVSGNSADAPMLSMEAAARGVTVAELVSKVDGNASTFAMLEAQIAGVDGRHRDAINALTTFEEVTSYDYSGGWPAL